ncbi:MAG TPA: type II toxin-antitoxin system VapC family toxin [Labilithrix sp.]|nr:type II toxin-antitoxin system VapC family toxin [Labilithrix sp.]
MGRLILFDTHIFMWWLADDPNLSRAHRRAIEEAERLFVSPASYWEIATKHRIGKLPDGPTYLLSKADLARVGVETLAMDTEDASAAGLLDWEHQDPFDRMLVCQAQHHGLRLLTSDKIVTRWLSAHEGR